MAGLTKLTWVLGPAMALMLTGCSDLQTGTASDRLKPIAAAHAAALAGEDMAVARSTGRVLLASLAAWAGWW